MRSASWSPAWNALVGISWGVMLPVIVTGILWVDTPTWWSRGFVVMGLFFCVGSTFAVVGPPRTARSSPVHG